MYASVAVDVALGSKCQIRKPNTYGCKTLKYYNVIYNKKLQNNI